jgi:hypothetical protein
MRSRLAGTALATLSSAANGGSKGKGWGTIREDEMSAGGAAPNPYLTVTPAFNMERFNARVPQGPEGRPPNVSPARNVLGCFHAVPSALLRAPGEISRLTAGGSRSMLQVLSKLTAPKKLIWTTLKPILTSTVTPEFTIQFTALLQGFHSPQLMLKEEAGLEGSADAEADNNLLSSNIRPFGWKSR